MSRVQFSCTVLVLTICQLAVPTCPADVTLVEEGTGWGVRLIYQMSVSPAAEPNPAMKFRLTVEPHRTIAGNAITHYLRSFGENSLNGPWKAARDKFGDEVHDWYDNEIAIADLPMEKLREVSDSFDSYVENHIARATICRDAQWGLSEEDLAGMEAIEFLLPSVQQTRSISRMLALRTRLAIADRRYDDAIDHMRMNYQLGQNVSKMKFLVANLVGIAEIGIANRTMIDLISAPDAPNMYWALAELPRPMIDLRNSIRLEMSLVVRLIPELANVETVQHSQEEWTRILNETMKSMSLVSALTSGGIHENPNPAIIGAVMAGYPVAKKSLVDQGMDESEVEKMAVAQVLLIDMVREYNRLASMYEKSLYVPLQQAQQITSAADEEIRLAKGRLRLGRILAGQLLPAVVQARSAQVRIEWQRNALQVIEAIRMHLAETGKLPASLKEVTVVPLPLNPVTGQSYQYSFDGSTAVLDLPFGEQPGMAIRFQIHVAK